MILKYVYCNIAGIIIWFVLATLFGAPFTQINRTLFFAVIMNLLTILPHLVMNSTFDDLLRIYRDHKFETLVESFVFYSTLGSILGAWFGAFPILLDWNRPWQKWPITCVSGAILGCLVALLYSYFVVHWRRKTRSKRNKIV